MRWDEERWIKLYTKDGPDLLKADHVTRGVWWELIRKLDRTGGLECGDMEGVALVVRYPVELVERALKRLRELKMIIYSDADMASGRGIVFAPNFVSAQEAISVGKLRQQKYREKLQKVTQGDAALRGVTESDAALREVTRRDASDDQRITEDNITKEEVGADAPAADEPQPTQLVLEPAREKPRKAKTVGPKQESTMEICWRAWRTTYAESRRNYGTYTTGPADGPCMKSVAAAVDDNIRTLDRPSEDRELLAKHWFTAYLADDGSGSFLRNQRHSLQFLLKAIPAYGAPKAWTNIKIHRVEERPQPTSNVTPIGARWVEPRPDDGCTTIPKELITIFTKIGA